MHLHEELRKARVEAGLSQSDLAKRSGIPRNQIVRAEKGENITLDTLRKIVVNLPAVENLTLLEGVHLISVSYPHQYRVMSSTNDAFQLMTAAMLAVLKAATDAREAVIQAERASPLAEQLLEGDVDPTLLYKRFESLVRELQTFPKTG